MTFRRPRSLAPLIGLTALGAHGFVPAVTAVSPATIPGTSRRAKTPRRVFAHQRGDLPGRKGVAQKRQPKQCHHRKTARNRRRTARLARR